MVKVAIIFCILDLIVILCGYYLLVTFYFMNNFLYTDDTAFMAENLVDLQTLINLVNEACRRIGLKTNTENTKA